MKHLRAVVAVTLLLLVMLSAAAQTGMRFMRITSEKGLCNDYIRCIFQDHTGFIWLGTYDGLSRYDGTSFVTYRRDFSDTSSLASNTIFDIGEDNRGILWISTGKGICHYDPHTGRIGRNELKDCPQPFYSYSIQVTGDHLWLPTDAALYDFRITGRGQLKLSATYTYPDGEGTYPGEHLYRDPKGGLWLILYGDVYSVNRQQQQLEKVTFTAADGVTIPRICAMTQSRDGRLWFCSWKAPVVSCGTRTAQGVHLTGNYILPQTAKPTGIFSAITSVTGIGNDNSEKILLATQSGAFLFDPHTTAFTPVCNNPADAYSLSNNYVTGLLHDAAGLTWITTAYGANVYDPEQQQLQTIFLDNNGDNNAGLFRHVLADGSKVWLGTAKPEIYCYDMTRRSLQRFILPAPANQAEQVQCFFRQSDGDIWTGGLYGLYRMGSNSTRPERITFPGEGPVSISCIRELTGGDLLITSFENGAWIYRPGKGVIRHFTTADGLFSNRCTYISEGSRGIFYITHIAPGLTTLDILNNKIEQTDFQHFLEKELSYPAAFTYCSYASKEQHTLWVGTGLGLLRYSPADKKGALIATTTRLNTDNEIWSIIPDGSSLWLKTTFGIYKFDTATQAITEFHALERRHIPSQEGYFRMCDAGSMLLVPGYQSLITLQKQKHCGPQSVSHIVLLNVLIDGKDATTENDTGAASVVLQQGQTSLALSFASLSFRRPEFTRYRYCLYGADGSWHSLGDKTSLSFANLKPGHYTLRIEAQTYDSATIIKPLLADITVKPFFWQTTWFFILLLLLAVSAIYLLYRYRISQLMAMQRIRQKISKDLHDDIGATISSIGLLAAITQGDNVAPEKKKQFLETIMEQARSASQSLSDIVWSVNPQNDQLDVVFARIQRFASELFEAKNISYDIILPSEKQLHISLPMIARQHIYLVFKEAINNIIKYAAAQQVHISVSITGKMIHVIIRDDGKGFDPEQVKMGNGISNMKKRIAELKGDFDISSAPGAGTEIQFSVPL